MSSFFQDAIAGALDTVRDVAGEPVVYVQGSAAIELTAVPASSAQPADEFIEASARIAEATRDWIITLADLVVAGVRLTPRRGDQVQQTVEGVTTVWEVTPDGDQVFRYSDRARTRIRVHTKERPA